MALAPGPGKETGASVCSAERWPRIPQSQITNTGSDTPWCANDSFGAVGHGERRISLRMRMKLGLGYAARYVCGGLNHLSDESFSCHRDGNLLHDLDTESFETRDFAWMVGQQANTLQVQVRQNLRANADLALGSSLAFRQGW